MIKLEIFNPETEKTEVYKKDKVTTRWLMKALELDAKTYDSEYEQMMALVDYVSQLFDITEDQILDGTESNKIIDTLQNIIFDVMGADEKKRKLIQEETGNI